MQSYFILALLWIIFGCMHSWLATEKVKLFMQRLLHSRYIYYRVGYSLLALITLVIIIVYQLGISDYYLWQNGLPAKISGIIIIIFGLSLMLLFTKKFFFHLSGAGVFLSKENVSVTLLQGSLYKFVRHPLYVATLIFIWGIFIYHPLLSNLISCIFITLYTRIGIYFEEQKLIRQFGEQYILYRQTTPMLIPFTKKKRQGN